MAKTSELARLFDAHLSELVELRTQVGADSVAALYAQVLYFYLQCDLAGLERVLAESRQKFGTTVPEQCCLMLAELRLRIRNHAIERSLLAEATQLAARAGDWAGEIEFVVGMSYSKIPDHALAQSAYQRAFQSLERLGARRKATKALFNHVVCESRVHPEKKLIADYHHLVKRAAKFKDYGTAAICCSNISREYQKLGALEVALRYCDRALKFLKDDIGTLDYYLVVVHRCHLLVDLGRLQEAELEFQTARSGDFPEVREALKVVDAIRNGSRPALDRDVNRKMLTPTWQERLEEKKSNQKRLTPLEGKLLQLIAQAPRTKFEIIAQLYPEKADFKLLEDRFKNLMNRLKKSRPGLIILENKKYRISDESFLEQHWVKQKRAS